MDATPRQPDDDAPLLGEALTALELAGCQFWACEGPTLKPIDMVSCHVCTAIAKLRHRLGEKVTDE